MLAKKNPTHREWVVEDQDEFLKWSRAFLAHKKTPTQTRIYTCPLKGTVSTYQVSRHIQDIVVVTWMYKLGRDLQSLRMTFDEFKSQIIQGNSYQHSRTGYRRNRWGYGGGWIGAGYFRGPRSYVRNVEHKPKILSEAEQACRDWREKKQFNWDRRGRWRSRSRKTWAKLYSNRSFRRYQKRCIYSQDFEALGAEYKDWFDSWDWD